MIGSLLRDGRIATFGIVLSASVGGPVLAHDGDRALQALIESGRLKVETLFTADVTSLPSSATTIVVRVEAAPGTIEPVHTHPGPKYLYVLNGEGAIQIDGRAVPARAGDVVPVPAGAQKAIDNRSAPVPLRVLAFLVLERGKPVLSVVAP